MDLDDGERYAAAALFTLALHTTQVETGVDEAGNPLDAFKAAWGCPDEELFDDLICVPEDEPWPGMEVPRGFWGFDCCAPQGLCRRVYRALNISDARWPGLLKMADVSSSSNPHHAQVALVKLARRYGAFLDPAVAPLISRALSVELEGDAAAGDDAAPAGDGSGGGAEEGDDGVGGAACPAADGGPSPAAAVEAEAVAAGDPSAQRSESVPLRPDEALPPSACLPAAEAAVRGTPPSGAAAAAGAPPTSALTSAGTAASLQAECGDLGARAGCRLEPGGAGVVGSQGPPSGATTVPAARARCPRIAGSPRTTPATLPKLQQQQQQQAKHELRVETDGQSPHPAGGGCTAGALDAATSYLEPSAAADLSPRGGEPSVASVRQQAGAGGRAARPTDEASDTSAAAASSRHNPTHQSVMALYELIGACLRASAAAGDVEAGGGNGIAAGAPAKTAVDDLAEPADSQEASAASGPPGGNRLHRMSEQSLSYSSRSCGGSGSDGVEGAKGRSSRFSLFSGGRLCGSQGGRAASSGGGGSKAAVAASLESSVHVVRRPLVRWYDARARVALRRLCNWLHLPAAKMHAMEQMWALQLLQLRPDGEFDLDAASGAAGGGSAGAGGRRYLTYLKISAGALGGAALLALSGGLAAPAIAAGLGSAIAVLGGSTAAATATAAAVTTLGGTAAGTAAITGTFGVIGASHAGSKAAALYGEVREFGFWSISAPLILPPPPSATQNPEDCDVGADPDDRTAQPPAAAAAAAGPGEDVGGSAGGWSSVFRWSRSKSTPAEKLPERVSAQDGASSAQQPPQPQLPQEPSQAPPQHATPQQQQQQQQQAEGHEGNGDAATAMPPLRRPPPPPPLRALPEFAQEGAERLVAQGPPPAAAPATGTAAAGALTAPAGRPSRSPSAISRDGLFIPTDLLAGDGGREHDVGRGGGGGGLLDPSHPAAQFRLSPVTPYPPRASDGGEAASAVHGGAAAPQPHDRPGHPGRAELAAAVGGVVDDVELEIIGITGHALDVTSNPSDGGYHLTVADGSTGASAGGAAASPTGVAMAPSATCTVGNSVTQRVLGSREDGGSPGKQPGGKAQGGGGSGSGGGDRDGDGGDTVEDTDDPWVAELSARERAQLADCSAGGPYMQALLAELDAEAADLDGVGDCRTAAAPPPPTAPVADAGASGRSSRWSWFRGAKQTQDSCSSSGGGAGVEGRTRRAMARGKAEQLRPLLRVPVDPRRSGDATLALTIAVNGWVKQPEDFVAPWRPLPSDGRELWALVWESDVLQSLGGALRRFIRDKAIEESSKMVLRLGVSTALVTAMMLPMAVMSAINITIGSRWRVALRRAQLAGRCLAHLLMQGGHGDRPVTLIGFSIGARLIFHCLLELSRCGARGLVESAVLLGTPVSAGEDRWRQARAAVSGRLVNAYSANDWVLGVVFRAHSRHSLLVQRPAGLSPVAVAGVENLNVSSLVAGHTQYLEKLEDVLSALNLAEH